MISEWITTVANFMQAGGPLMYIIATVWFCGLAIAFERFMKLNSKLDIDGPSFMNEIQRYVLSNDIEGAIRVCSGSEAALPRVLKSGLKRANHPTEKIQNALDATALEVVPKIEMRLPYMQLIASVSTLFGLLGTVFALTKSFAAVGAADPSTRSTLLAEGISLAMNATALGLLSAITLMILHSFLVAKADKIISEVDEYSVKLLDLLDTKDNK